MTLGEQQRLFVRLIGQLIAWAYANGYELTFGEAQRSDEQAEINAMGFTGRAAFAEFINRLWPMLAAKIRNNAGSGIRGSLHEKSLAIDFHLFKDGVYLTSTAEYQPLGVQWESMHPLARWGGRFTNPDGDHFSLEWQGVK